MQKSRLTPNIKPLSNSWAVFQTDENNIANKMIFPIDKMIEKSFLSFILIKKIMDINTYQQQMEKAIAYLENEFK